jgi:hypothetical protein
MGDLKVDFVSRLLNKFFDSYVFEKSHAARAG